MPKYNPSADDEEMYGDVQPPAGKEVPGGTMPDEKPDGEDKAESVDEETEDSQHTAVVDNKILMGPDGQAPKVGDEIVVKVVKSYGNEAEIAYSTTKPNEIGASKSPTSDSEIEALDTQGGQ